MEVKSFCGAVISWDDMHQIIPLQSCIEKHKTQTLISFKEHLLVVFL